MTRMPATNVLANLFVTLYNTEARRRGECLVHPASSLCERVLAVLKEHDYIDGYERIEDGRGGKLRVALKARITKCGAISPRFKVRKDEYAFWEQQYLPSYDRGMLLVTTSRGVKSHDEAVREGIGGFLIGYVY